MKCFLLTITKGIFAKRSSPLLFIRWNSTVSQKRYHEENEVKNDSLSTIQSVRIFLRSEANRCIPGWFIRPVIAVTQKRGHEDNDVKNDPLSAFIH